jgi:hypothetical protein
MNGVRGLKFKAALFAEPFGLVDDIQAALEAPQKADEAELAAIGWGGKSPNAKR